MRKLLLSIALILGLGALVAPSTAKAQQPFIGQIQLFGMTWCPQGWAEANGDLLAVASWDALFSLYGTIYGGDGRTTFGLPDFRGRAPVTAGQGAGLSFYREGQKSGRYQANMLTGNLPAHTHITTINAASDNATTGSPANALLAPGATIYARGGAADAQMPSGTLAGGSAGGSRSVNLMQPYLAMTYCVALVGIYPSRT